MNDVVAKITAMEEEMKQLRDMMGKVLTAIEDNMGAQLTAPRPSYLPIALIEEFFIRWYIFGRGKVEALAGLDGLSR